MFEDSFNFQMDRTGVCVLGSNICLGFKEICIFAAGNWNLHNFRARTRNSGSKLQAI